MSGKQYGFFAIEKYVNQFSEDDNDDSYLLSFSSLDGWIELAPSPFTNKTIPPQTNRSPLKRSTFS